MIAKVTAYMRKHHMINSGDHICIGVSGGADSVCLFLILEKLRWEMNFSISVVHIEHGIRGKESIADMEFVQKLADQYDVPCCCYSFAVEELAAKEGLTVEEAGRKVRYAAFHKEENAQYAKAKARGGEVKTAVAHHGDDNAETMLFHMCRGSGIDGMAGIRPVRDHIIRPLLCVTRKEIEDFLEAEAQDYCIDATNKDVIYSRNRIRNQIMPEIAKINQQAVLHMNHLAEDMADISAYLKAEVEKILEQSIERNAYGISFDIKGIEQYPRIIQRQLLMAVLEKVTGSRKDIGREHIQALMELVEGRTGRNIDLPYEVTAQKSYDKIVLFRKKEEKILETVCMEVSKDVLEDGESWNMDTMEGKFVCKVFAFQKKYTEIPKNRYTKWFDYDMIKGRLYFRTRRPGDYLLTDAEGHRQKLKAYWINEKVPKAERNQRMLLAEESHILWVVGGRISEGYKVTENTKRVLEVQLMEEK